MKYLLDSNTLIEAKNRYYRMDFCPAYWQWIKLQNEAKEVASISLVGDELKRGNDELAAWAKDHEHLFLDISDQPTQQAFAKIAQEVSDSAATMKSGAVDEFLSGADPWLIAKALTTGAVVVTHESFNEQAKRKFLIPNICAKFGVEWMDTFDLLHRLDAKFVLPA